MLKLFSIIVEGKLNVETGFFQTFKVLSDSTESAINLVLSQEEMQNKEIKIEEVEELENNFVNIGYPKNSKILEETGRIYFNLTE
jgi:hypothetical protein